MKNSTRNKLFSFLALAIVLPGLAACNNKDNDDDRKPITGPYFSYEDADFNDLIGTNTNSESHDYDGLKVNKTENDLREDFAFGVDASMTYVVENNGGIYYNENGEEQDVFQILKRNGVNFVRFRLWNKPRNLLRMPYGGGNNDVDVDIALAQRAKAANLNVMIDFHYSDFWADPDKQNRPIDWGKYTDAELPEVIKNYTAETLNKFKDAGVTVDAVQIGNEINNGMSGYYINWNNASESYAQMAKMIQGGVDGAKSVFKDVRTMIHLANGGNTEEFKSFFGAMETNKVDYDIIGASYYPHLSGSLDELQTNLDSVSELTGKPVMVAETSWGFTTDYNEYTANQYTAEDENVGNYLTSEQAQATCIRDICNVLSKVKNNKGLGIFYWEPGWLPVKDASWATAAGQSYSEYGNDSKRGNYEDGLASWSNQGLFSYTGKALSSLQTYKCIREGKNSAEEVALRARDEVINVTLNLAENESLPTTARVVTDFDAIRKVPCTWSAEALEAIKTKGQHDGLTGTIQGGYSIVANAKCIQNFVKDPGFENQGTTDDVKDPWRIVSQTPVNDKVVKLDRKKDIRSGRTDLNWFHSTSEFSFNVAQDITIPTTANYTLTTYILSESIGKKAHKELKVYMQIQGGELIELDICNGDYLKGWSAGYQTCTLPVTHIEANTKITIGIKGRAEVGTWAHNDDWELVNDLD